MKATHNGYYVKYCRPLNAWFVFHNLHNLGQGFERREEAESHIELLLARERAHELARQIWEAAHA